MDDNFVPIIGVFCVFGLPVLGWVTVRILQHRERMAMLQHGIVPPMSGRRFRRACSDWSAAQTSWNGPGPSPVSQEDGDDPQITLHRGIRTAMIGLALLIGLSFIGYHGGDGPLNPPSVHPGPWLLGGLIPMFVGLSQIIIALVSGARIMTIHGPLPPATSPPNGSSSYSNYGAPPQAGTPRQHYEELRRPAPPPERKSGSP